MLKQIIPNIPEHKVYTETFFGGGAVFFAKQKAQSEIINDTNAMVVNFYEVCKTDFIQLKKKIEATTFSRATYNVAWAIYRMPHLFSKLQQAWAFYIATNMGFSCKIGSWGFDKYGKRVKVFQNKKTLFDDKILKRLSNVQIEHNDAIKVLSLYNTEDAFHYVDPPYINSDQGHYGGYDENSYKNLLEALERVKGKFLLSNYPSDLLMAYIKKNNWFIQSFEKPLSAHKGKSGIARNRKKTEVLVANYPLV